MNFLEGMFIYLRIFHCHGSFLHEPGEKCVPGVHMCCGGISLTLCHYRPSEAGMLLLTHPFPMFVGCLMTDSLVTLTLSSCCMKLHLSIAVCTSFVPCLSKCQALSLVCIWTINLRFSFVGAVDFLSF